MLNAQNRVTRQDQAAGLRQLMVAPKTKLITILKTAGCHEQTALLANLAAPFAANGHKVLVLQATEQHSAHLTLPNDQPTLLDALIKKIFIQNAIHDSDMGFSMLKLASTHQLSQLSDTALSQQLNRVFDQIALDYEIVLVEANLNQQDLLPIEALNRGEIVIQLTQHAESIQEAYALIKQLYNQLGTRSFGIIVDSASDAKGHIIFERIAQVAHSFMQVQLEYLGAIPPDVYLSRAAKLGRCVVEAFPMAIAAKAFKQIAGRLEHQHAFSNPNKFIPII